MSHPKLRPQRWVPAHLGRAEPVLDLGPGPAGLAQPVDARGRRSHPPEEPRVRVAEGVAP